MTMGAERLLEYHKSREAAIERERNDPFRYGVELDHWKIADDQLGDHGELLILGGNRIEDVALSKVKEILTR